MTQNTSVATRQPNAVATLKTLLDGPAYKGRLAEVLKDRAPQFAASLIQVVGGTPALKACEPNSIIAAAMTAATLDLPIEKNLGFAHIVPYKGVASFQMGYKGFVQLALRTNQYSRMNACKINAEAYKGRDEVGEPIIDWEKLDETKPAAGYFFGFKTTSGFIKGVYWTKEKTMAHAQQYSQSFRGGYDSVWKTNPDAMGLKTVVKDGISHWGVMSVQLQRAIMEDQGTRADIDSAIVYPDNVTDAPPKVKPPGATVEVAAEVVVDPPEEVEEQAIEQPPETAQPATQEAPKRGPGRPRKPVEPVAAEPTQATEPAPVPDKPAVKPDAEPLGDDATPPQLLVSKLEESLIPEERFCAWAAATYHIPPCKKVQEMFETAPARIFKILSDYDKLLSTIEAGTK